MYLQDDKRQYKEVAQSFLVTREIITSLVKPSVRVIFQRLKHALGNDF